MKSQIQTVYIEIYDFNIYYLISDWKQCRLELEDAFGKDDEPEENTGTGYALPIIQSDERKAYFIWIDKDANFSTRIHECFHAVVYIMRDYLDIQLDDNSEEAFAYLLTYIVRKVL